MALAVTMKMVKAVSSTDTQGFAPRLRSCITAVGRSYDELRIPDCGAQVEIGFNNRYLLDALRACPDEKFVLGLKSSLSPCTIRPVEGNRFTYLVLPVRLKAGN